MWYLPNFGDSTVLKWFSERCYSKYVQNFSLCIITFLPPGNRDPGG